MATIQKRKNSYRVQIRRGGKNVSASFDTKQEATDWSVRAEARLLEGETAESVKMKPVISHAFTGADMLMRYRNEVSPTKRGARWEQVRLNKLVRDYKVFQRPACAITGPDMARWRDARLNEVSPSSVNRELCLISSVFSKALREWEVGITTNPVANIEKPKKARPRVQRVSEGDRLSLERELGWDGLSAPTTSSQWTAFAFKLAVLTAMRKGEILSLDWNEIDFEGRFAHLDLTKNGEARDVPLSHAALHLLRSAKPLNIAASIVPITSGNLDVIFREAREATDLLHVRFHDSRREATSTIASKFNILELSAITGHKCLQMLKVYYRPDPSELARRLD